MTNTTNMKAHCVSPSGAGGAGGPCQVNYYGSGGGSSLMYSNSPNLYNIVDIHNRIANIENMLAILLPDLNKIEKFAALKSAYDNYLTLLELVKNE